MDAMAEVCADKGYAAATVADVVECARVSRATFYELFKDKSDCFIATMEEGVRMLGSAVLPVVYAPSESWAIKVRETIAALLDFLASNPAYAKTAMIEALAGGNAAFERYSVGTNLIVTLLDEGRSYVRPDVTAPSGTARAILGGGEWLIRGEMMAGRTDRIRELLPDFLYMALTPYIGQEEALNHAREAREGLLS